MIRNYFKIALRNLWKNKAFTAINLSGLVIGMAAVILIGIWIQNELSFDRFYVNENSLYKVYNRSTDPGEISIWDITSGPLGKTLKKDFPEVENAARTYWSSERLFSVGDKSIKSKGNEVDGSFLKMFGFPLLQGNADYALDNVNDIVITKAMAIKLFGNDDPINKIIKIDNETNYKVSAVLKDLPSNTEFDFDYLISLKANEKNYSSNDSWGVNTFYTYVQLKPDTSIDNFNEKIKNVVGKNSDKYKWDIFLYPISQTHLYSRFENGKVAGGRIERLRLMAIIGALILLIACINFMNLSTAQSQKRAKEVGVRKVIGAGKGSLVVQFLCESVLLSAIAGIFALVVAAIFLPYFNQLIEKSLKINFSNPLLWFGIGGFVLFTGLLAGSYPAFFLSSFKPVKVLKGSFKDLKNSFNPRKVLVVLQFAVGIALVIATMIIYQQINYTESRSIGYNINNLIEVPIEGSIIKNYDIIKTELLSSRAVTEISKTGWGVTVNGSNSSGFKWEGADNEDLNFSLYRTGGDFAKTMGLKLLAGRDIDFSLFPGDSTSVMINATAVKRMGIKDPVGKVIRKDERSWTIVGIFNDFILDSPYYEVSPMLVFGSVKNAYSMVMRLNENNNTAKNLNTVEKVFNKYNPSYPFMYHFVDQEYGQKFKNEKQMASLSSVFAGLTIFISCLGLFGLAAYMAQNRSKEIGIRKVLGASVGGIIKMLSKEFLLLVVIAIIIAVPISWYVMNEWLMDYSYRIDIGWISFLYASIGILLIALLTVSFQAIKAAVANPVKSLRTE